MTSALLRVVSAGLIAAATVGATQQSEDPDAIIDQLGKLPNGLPASPRGDGKPYPTEERRQELTGRLASLGDDALPAVARGLKSVDVSIRRNLVLSLWMLQLNTKFSEAGRKVIVMELSDALKDQDFTVRAWSAQALGSMGSVAVPAVPGLITRLDEPELSIRVSTCLALTKIGPGAKAALPALRRLLSDPDERVRRFAQQAMDAIDVDR